MAYMIGAGICFGVAVGIAILVVAISGGKHAHRK